MFVIGVGTAWLGTGLRVNKSWFDPRPPNGGGPRNRSCELAFQNLGIIRIAQQCPILGPVDTGDEHWIDVTVPSLAGKLYPRTAMFFRVLFKGAQPPGVFPVDPVLSEKDSSSPSRELERSGFRHARVQV